MWHKVAHATVYVSGIIFLCRIILLFVNAQTESLWVDCQLITEPFACIFLSAVNVVHPFGRDLLFTLGL